MKEKTMGFTVLLTVLSGLYFLGTFLLYDYLKVHYFIVKNIFLALVPLYFSWAFLYCIRKKGLRVLGGLFFLLWLLFFPNGPYIVTDLIHLSRYALTWYQYNNMETFLNWLGLIHLFSGIMLGLFAGMLSLYLVQMEIRKRLGNGFSLLFFPGVCLLSGIAIYIGRFMRFNSWDVFTNPLGLFAGIAAEISWLTAAFCLLFGFMTAVLYIIFLGGMGG